MRGLRAGRISPHSCPRARFRQKLGTVVPAPALRVGDGSDEARGAEGMASGYRGSVVGSLGRLFEAGTVAGLSEAQLLERFLAQGDEAAFEAILQRHGPMVLGVCRRVLDDPHDIADAFQATFLILVKKARSIRDRDALGTWLYGVARRVAVRAKVNARRRHTRERTGIGAEGLDVDAGPRAATGSRRRSCAR